MRLEVTVAAAPGLLSSTDTCRPDGALKRLPQHPVELTVTFHPDASAALLAQQLARELTVPVNFWVGGVPLDTLQAGTPPLTNGAVIVASAPHAPPHRRREPARPLLLAVLSGPDAGHLIALRRGRYSLGRNGCDINIADPALSRLHGELRVNPTGVLLHDMGSSNGIKVDGKVIATAPITTESAISMGATTIGLRFADTTTLEDPGRHEEAGTGAKWPAGSSDGSSFTAGSSDGSPPGTSAPSASAGTITSTATRAMPYADAPLRVPRDEPQRQRAMLLSMAILPLIVGVGLAIVTGLWMFLAFSAMSAVTAIITLTSGRKRRKKFNAALRAATGADLRRRHQAAPPLADLVHAALDPQRRNRVTVPAGPASVRSDAPLGPDQHRAERSPAVHAATFHLPIRLGLADQRANIRLDPPDREFVAPILRAVPVVRDLGRMNGLTLRGSPAATVAVVRTVLMQLAAPQFPTVRVLLLGHPHQLPLSARFLPGVVLVSSTAALSESLAAMQPPPPAERLPAPDTAPDLEPAVLMVFAADLAAAYGRELTAMTTSGRLTVLWCGCAPPDGPSSILQLSGTGCPAGHAILHDGSEAMTFLPDLISARSFDRYARARAGSTNAQPASRRKPLPRLLPLPPVEIHELSARWRASSRQDHLPVQLGVSAGGPLVLDLQADGPHLLVAGTTGSGKSEFLRTLLLGLAQRYGPDHITLLLIDFKGGSGLRPLAALPHCVGLLTDLSAESVARALESLRAEIRRREQLFADAGADDLTAFRRSAASSLPPLPHLVLVIDEFRVLMDEVPGALDELLRIATVGRSLGVHLVMATQRPQGAVSADIRANVSTTIALRVRSGFESQDLIDAPDAAGISSRTPGRAFLKRAAETAVEFQSASSGDDGGAAALAPCELSPAHEFLTRSGRVTDAGKNDRPGALNRHVQQIIAAGKVYNSPSMHAPIAPPLPLRLPASGTSPIPSDDTDAPLTLALGRLDLPARQRVDKLVWTPEKHSHLALIGAETGGVNDALRQILAQWLRYRPDRGHLYVLDGDGAAPSVKKCPHVGAYVSGDELRRAARVLKRLAEVAALRRSANSATGPTIGLFITGWGQWLAAFRSSPWPWAEDALQELVQNGPLTRVPVLVCGDRELVTARFFAAVPNRIYFPTGASPESLLPWPKLPPMASVPGRAYVQGRLVPEPGVAQWFPGSNENLEQTIAAAAESGMTIEHANSTKDRPLLPFRVDPLPRHLPVSSLKGHPSSEGELLLGVAGDELQPVAVRLLPGDVLLILGPPGSGRTNALNALTALNEHARTWIRGGGTNFWSDYRVASAEASAEEIAMTVLLVDDADRLPPDAHQHLTVLQDRGYTVVLTAATAPAVTTRVPLALQARSSGKGVLLCPRSPLDGDVFGVRVEVEPQFIAGRAAIIDAGRSVQAQLAWKD